ncbi:MAG: hypothetical protein HQK87_11700, partial [Nitrospinae bacterium]|nr:hypothetical protein [Nitrospinota bacterium]
INGRPLGANFIVPKGARGTVVLAADGWYMGFGASNKVLDFQRKVDNTDHLNLSPCSTGGTLVSSTFALITSDNGYLDLVWQQGSLILPSAPSNNGTAALGLKIDGTPIFSSSLYYDGAAFRTVYGTPVGVRKNTGYSKIGGGCGSVINSAGASLRSSIELSKYGILAGEHTCQFILGSVAYEAWDDPVNFIGTDQDGIFYVTSFSA